jgi:hypothetical protein
MIGSTSKIYTNSNYKELKDVTEDDLIMDEDGEFVKIKEIKRDIYTGELYSIRVRFRPENILIKGEREVIIREMIGGKGRISEREFGEIKIMKIKELKRLTCMGIKINKKEIIPEFEFIQEHKKRGDKILKIKLDEEDMWYMMGYFVGNGWIMKEKQHREIGFKYTIMFAFNEKHIEELVPKFQKYINLQFKTFGNKTEKCSKYICGNYLWYHVFEKFGKYAHGKFIPQWVIDAPKNLVDNFLKGYEHADGHLSCKKISPAYTLTTVSVNLAYQSQLLYLKLGHLFSNQKFTPPEKGLIKGKIVNLKPKYSIRGIKSFDGDRRTEAYIDEHFALYPNREIKKINVENKELIDITLENGKKFILENLII